MSRRFPARAALMLSLVLGAGCQDYNFNPVGHCLIQPGTERVPLSNISTADVLFVVDDSGSMGAEQTNIAAAFSAFISNLDAANAARAAAGLEPFDFHIAVTSTSVFWNYQTGQTCTSSCPGAGGQLVCCAGGTPARQPRACTSNAQCTVAGTTCRTDCSGFKGEGYCCGTGGTFPAGSISDVIPCSRDGAACGTFEHHYNFFGGCTAGVAVDEWPYPRGDFVSWSNATLVNPRVLHFDKELYPATTWSRVAQGTTGSTTSGTLAKGPGTNRGLVVVVTAEYGTAFTTFAPTVTYGGQAAARLTSTDGNSSQKTWIGWLTEAQIAAATGSPPTLSTTVPAANLIASATDAGFYMGVNQAAILRDSTAVASDAAAASVAFGRAVAYDGGGLVLYALSIDGATGSNPPAGYSEQRDAADSASNNFEAAVGEAQRSVASSSNDNVTFASSQRYALAVVSLSPAAPGGTIRRATTNRQGFTSEDLMAFFAGGTVGPNTYGANVITGTCGSGEEQGLSAARLALEKAVAGQQRDTYSMAAGKQVTWDQAARVAGSQAEWLHPNSKLVLVFIGDEDDCSSPDDPSAGIVMGTGGPGADACTSDNGTKLYGVASQFVDYFAALGRPLGAAFIESAAQTSCSGLDPAVPGYCTAGTCCQQNCPSAGVCGQDTGPTYCGGQAPANRFFQAAGLLKNRGTDLVVGSICDPDFGTLLRQIAELVKPPSTLELPSMPAESAITLLRIADASGKTRKVCGRPLPPRTPTNYTLQEARDAVDPNGVPYDWWFAAANQPGPPVALSQFIYINPKGACIANPGETYSADYLGRMPATGCRIQAGDDCVAALGGQLPDAGKPYTTGSWTCFAGVDTNGHCLNPATTPTPGTCVCGTRAETCPEDFPTP